MKVRIHVRINGKDDVTSHTFSCIHDATASRGIGCLYFKMLLLYWLFIFEVCILPDFYLTNVRQAVLADIVISAACTCCVCSNTQLTITHLPKHSTTSAVYPNVFL